MIRKTIAGGIVWTCLFLFLTGCGSIPKHPVVKPDSKALIDPKIVYGVLPNGFQYVLKSNKQPEGRVNIHLDVFAGSLHEADNQQGLAHYLEHMLFNGSEHFQPGELIEYFQSIGMDFGGDANAHTGFFNTVYDLSIPEANQTSLDKAFLVIQDYAKGALLLESEIDRERGIILAEKRERDSVGYRTYKKTLAFELKNSLVNKRFPIGIESVLKNSGRKELKAYYDTWYRPDNMLLIVVGDVDLSLVQQMIKTRFSKLTSRQSIPVKEPVFNWDDQKGINAFYHHESEAGSTDITIEALKWEPFEYETVDKMKNRVVVGIANSILQNRIDRKISRQAVDFSQGGTYAGKYLHHIRLAAISATCDPHQWEKGLTQIDQLLRQALVYGFSQKELDRVKVDMISHLEQARDLESSKKTGAVAKQLLNHINSKRLLLSADQKNKILIPFIESLNLKDVHQAFKQAWNIDNRFVLVTGNLKIELKDPVQKILDVYKKSMAVKVDKYTNFSSKQFPYLKVENQTQMAAKVDNSAKDLGVKIIEFGNHIRLNLKKTKFKPNLFKFKLCVGQGKRSLPLSKPGLADIAETVMQESGLGSLDNDQLKESLAGKKISAGFSIQDNYIAFSGSSDTKDAETVFQLIYHALNDPGFRPHALELYKTRYKQRYDSLLQSADGVMQVKAGRFLAMNDSRFGLPSPEIVNQYTLKDIKTWVMPMLEKGSVELSIVGDFDEQKIIEMSKRYLGAINQRQAFPVKPQTLKKVLFPYGKHLDLRVDTKIENGIIDVAFKTDDFWDIMQTRRLSVLSRVFSERLRLVIREELGEAYSPYVYNRSSMLHDEYGVLHTLIKVQPSNHKKVYEKIIELIHSLNQEGISEKEVELALKPVLHHLKELKKTNGYWLNSVLANSSNHRVKFDWARNILPGYSSINNQDLNMLVKKYLRIEKSAKILILPKKK